MHLKFPLENGTYFIGEAGSSLIVNYRTGSERYGLDIHKLNGFGMRASGIHPLDNERYVIFGEPAHSPCDGTIAKAVDGIEEIPPASSPDSWFPAGNLVVIECGPATVTLAHLKMGSVRAEAGEVVAAGQRIGSVGNSGNSNSTTPSHPRGDCKWGRRSHSLRWPLSGAEQRRAGTMTVIAPIT